MKQVNKFNSIQDALMHYDTCQEMLDHQMRQCEKKMDALEAEENYEDLERERDRFEEIHDKIIANYDIIEQYKSLINY